MKLTFLISTMREVSQMLTQVPSNIDILILWRPGQCWKTSWCLKTTNIYFKRHSFWEWPWRPCLSFSAEDAEGVTVTASLSSQTNCCRVPVLSELVTVYSKQAEKQFWQQDRKTGIRMTNHGLREVEDGFWQIKQLFGDVLCLLVHTLVQKEIATILPSHGHMNQLACKRNFTSNQHYSKKHCMSLSINQPQFW